MELVIMPDGYHVRVDLKMKRGSVTVSHGFGTMRAVNEFIELFEDEIVEWSKRISEERMKKTSSPQMTQMT